MTHGLIPVLIPSPEHRSLRNVPSHHTCLQSPQILPGGWLYFQVKNPWKLLFNSYLVAPFVVDRGPNVGELSAVLNVLPRGSPHDAAPVKTES